jgi:hypothetical protein
MKDDSDEYRKLTEQRYSAGKLINPTTAEVARWYANYFDPYNDGLELSDEADLYERLLFVSAPGSDSCVFICDLPEATQDEVQRRIDESYSAKETERWLVDRSPL